MHPGAFSDERLVAHEYLVTASPVQPHPEPCRRLLLPPPNERRRWRRDRRLEEEGNATGEAKALGERRREG